jgi:hypothetical protein
MSSASGSFVGIDRGKFVDRFGFLRGTACFFWNASQILVERLKFHVHRL